MAEKNICGNRKCKKEKPCKCGRPSEFKEKYIKKVDSYLKANQDKTVEVVKQENTEKGYKMYDNKLTVQLPTLEGFALYIKVSKQVLLDWEKKYPKFLCALNKIRTEQHKRLINSGLSGDYNSTIAKLILSSNHNMVERIDSDINIKGKLTIEDVKGKLKNL